MFGMTKSDENLSSNMEDYLEAIHHIAAAKRAARAKDIAEEMGVSASSVTGALHALSQRGLVNYAPYDIVTLTDEGEKIAGRVTNRHAVLLKFFEAVLHLDRAQADAEACKVEHVVSATTIERLSRLTEFIESRPDVQHVWAAGGRV